MTAARFYSSTAGSMELQASITDTSTTITVDATTGLPGTTPYTLVIDPGTTEEIVTVTGVSGVNLTVTRGVDGSPAQSHNAGATIRHMATARDFREPQEHIGSTAAHGVAGAIVGTTDTQTLTNKNLTSATNVFPSSLATDAELAAHTGLTAAHGATGAVVGTTNSQALTNKDLTSGTNTFPGSLATDTELAAHGTATTGVHGVGSGFVVGTNASQTLTAKVMSGANNTFSNIPESAITNLSTDLGTLTAANTAVNTRCDNLPQGEVAYAEISASSALTTSGTPVNVAGLSINPVLSSGRKYKLTAWLQPNSTVQGDSIGVLILGGGTTQEVGSTNTDTGNATVTVLSKRINAPTSGTKNFQVQIYRSSGTGSVNIVAGTNGVAYIMLEDIGVAS